MIQDIAPHQYRNEYKPSAPKAESFLLCYNGRNMLVRYVKDEILFPTFGEAEKTVGSAFDLYGNYTYLFSIDECSFYLGNTNIGEKLCGQADYVWEDAGGFRSMKPKDMAFAGITGWQLERWYGSRRFCGRCGKPMVHDDKERMMKCSECGLMEFPKICPAVIVGVTHGSKILMSKYAGREFKKYALLAGFCEVGETVEETVRREVMEEVGLKVKNIRYYKSQPWSLSDTLLMGFFCDLDGGEEITLDKDELALAQWFDREEMQVEDEDCSLTNAMMMAFKRGEV
ncbi:MAG: NAD(+) diphosphatase [Lachnospiraceae bacterium]|nr:NAD(+) diphosphatase [Lachnospiraceae bacterium]